MSASQTVNCPIATRSIGHFFALMALVPTMFFSAAFVAAQDAPVRPATEDLLPETTAAFLQIDNVQETIPKLFGGELLEDDAIAPFVQRMYQEAETAYAEVKDEVGMSLQQMRDLPTGEMCVAVIAPRRKDLQFLIAIDLDPESESAEAARDAARGLVNRVENQSIDLETTEEGIEIRTAQVPDGELGARTLNWFLHEGWFVGCTSKNELLAVVERLQGREVPKVRPLSSNRKFITIMNRCRDTNDIQPEIRFFADPLKLARSGLRGNVAALAALNFLPTLGLDGVLAFGGAAILHNEEFRAVLHGHLLLANPKAGLLETLALKPGDSRPAPFVPADTTVYSSTHWDAQKAIVEIEKIIDTINGPGTFERDGKARFKEQTGFDLQTDIIDQLEGRVIYMQWTPAESSYLLNNACQAVAIEVNDAEKVQQLIEGLRAKAKERSGDEEKFAETNPSVEYEGSPVWSIDRSSRRRRKAKEQNQNASLGENFRMPEMTISIVDHHVVIADSTELVRHLIDVSQGTADALADDASYTDRMETLLQAAGTDVPCAISFSNPEPAMRDLIRLLNDERSKQWVMDRSEKMPWLGNLIQALEEQPVPDYDVLKKYFSPAGMIVTTDDTGYHMLSFQYQPEADE